MAVAVWAICCGGAAGALPARVSVLDYGAFGDGRVDDTDAIQRAHDALPPVGGTIYFPRTAGCYLLGRQRGYVNITKPNVTLSGERDAWICSPGSEDSEVRTGDPWLNGLAIRGNNAVVSINMRGPSVAWTATHAADRLMVRDMEFRNIYNAGIAINNTAFAELNVDNVVFNTSRDLASDPGNYHAISRSASSTDGTGASIRVNRSVFRATAGGIDAHNVRNLSIGGGTRFLGCDYVCIKLATVDNRRVEQNLRVDASVSFDGATVNTSSANRHLSTTRAGRVTAGSAYLGFIQVFTHVEFRGSARNYNYNGLTFLDGTFTEAIIDLDGSRWENSPAAIVDPQGTFTLRGATMRASNLVFTGVGTPRRITISKNTFVDSVLNITKRASARGDLFEIVDNDISYGLDDVGPIRFVDYGTDSGPRLLIDRNRILLRAQRNVAMDLGSAGTKAYLGTGNQYDGGLVTGHWLPGAGWQREFPR